MPGIEESAQKPLQAAGSCHKALAGASTRKPAKAAKMGQISPLAACGPPEPRQHRAGPVPNAFGARVHHLGCTNHDVATKPRHRLFSGAQNPHSDHSAMTHEKDNRDRQAAAPAKESRQDRLKLALRENLKRRKSQARGRSDIASASSETTDASLDDADEKSRPGRK
jgi:hypothetical protein